MYDTGERTELNDLLDLLEVSMIIGSALILFGGIATFCALGEGEHGPLIVGILAILFGLAWMSGSEREAKARRNRMHYWEHYYDDDQVAARNRRR